MLKALNKQEILIKIKKITSSLIMKSKFKKKNYAILFAISFGFIGLHRFYLYGLKDVWGWSHIASVLISILLKISFPSLTILLTFSPLLLLLFFSYFEIFKIGLMTDEKWDSKHNLEYNKKTLSNWQIPFVLVITLFISVTLFLYILARSIDLIITGGSFG